MILNLGNHILFKEDKVMVYNRSYITSINNLKLRFEY